MPLIRVNSKVKELESGALATDHPHPSLRDTFSHFVGEGKKPKTIMERYISLMVLSDQSIMLAV